LVGVDKVLRAEAAQQPFTLVLMDYTMPLCDGAEVLKERHVWRTKILKRVHAYQARACAS
jgi:CheY-like chemotaxis protein